ncbi:MAG: hypothetical protein M1829_002873 [Trizodia sp. TS-e1964]|nr:MAG: hypothetical protein M1829_002873 [Trizodia sp. TS-e1964]
MVSILNRHHVCFYCGRRSAQTKNKNVREWRCEKCDAVNYLDEHGEITDPPVPPSPGLAPAVQFAQAVNRPSSPVFSFASDNLFCKICLKNQHLLTSSLASYLPATTDPSYPSYESQYPSYRKSLEERYPQVCVQCEPRVRARIKAAGYAAKADHLRRMMERTRGLGKIRDFSSYKWQEFAVFLGAIGWWASLIGELIWHLLGAMTISPSPNSIYLDSANPSHYKCLAQALKDKEVQFGCADPFVINVSLLLGLLTLWWNPKLPKMVRGSGGRMVGLNDYYALQIGAFVLRYLVNLVIQSKSFGGLNWTGTRALHGFMMVFLIFYTLLTRGSVKLDHTPRVSFHHDEQEPLLAAGQQISNIPDQDYPTPPSSQPDFSKILQKRQHREFPISRLAPVRADEPQVSRPILPWESHESDENAMDWAPSREAFRPVAPRTRIDASPAEPIPSPFYGHLPPAPKSQAEKLRNPYFQSKAPEIPVQKPENYWKPRSPEAPKDSLQEVRDYEFAQPQFFVKEPGSSTGLEDIFNAAFTIHDDRSQPPQHSNWQSYELGDSKIGSKLFGILLLIISFTAWQVSSGYPHFQSIIRFGAMGLGSIAVGRALLTSSQAPGHEKTTSAEGIPTALLILELLSCLPLAGLQFYTLSHPILTGSSPFHHLLPATWASLIDKIGTTLLAAMVVHQVWLLLPKRRLRATPDPLLQYPSSPSPRPRSNLLGRRPSASPPNSPATKQPALTKAIKPSFNSLAASLPSLPPPPHPLFQPTPRRSARIAASSAFSDTNSSRATSPASTIMSPEKGSRTPRGRKERESSTPYQDLGGMSLGW